MQFEDVHGPAFVSVATSVTTIVRDLGRMDPSSEQRVLPGTYC